MKTEITKHLFDILKDKGEVFVKGLGVFTLVKLPATYGEGRKSLLPPSVEIKFQKTEEGDESILIEKLVNHEGFSHGEASSAVFSYARNTQISLDNNKEAKIGLIGTLYKKSEKWIFEQDKNTVNGFYLGLPELILPVFDRNANKTIAESNVQKEQIATSNTKINNDSQDSSSLSSILKKVIPILLLCLLIYGFISLVRSCNAMLSSDAEYQKQLVDPKPIIEEDTVEIVPVEQIISADTLYTEPCIIILGAYSNIENASELIEKIESNNLTLYSEKYGPYNRVGFTFECSEQDDLKRYLRDIRVRFNKNAWYLSPEINVE